MAPDAKKYYRPKDPAYIRELIDRAGVSQAQAGRLIGVDPRTVRHWVAGTADYTYRSQYALEMLSCAAEKS